MENFPYRVESVDNALRLLLMLQRNPQLRLSDAADELGIARSTAHRLLTTLRNRDFVTQGADKLYRPGAAMYRFGTPRNSWHTLVDAVRPHLRWLAAQLGETAHLVVRDGSDVRFLDSVESERPLQVGSRIGVVFPAHLTSGGKALMAELPEPQLAEVLASRRVADPSTVRRELNTVRRCRFGMNNGESEPGVTAMGMCLRDSGNHCTAALTVSTPTMRFRRAQIPAIAKLLTTATQRAHADLTR
ncbi:IclR family transcriptional regulator [Nocardia suismassiliense]|uniref:IclR family transcriptional regulator n=1 Tax=Nocardia suismassiliense TaxID=2077092 RepID=UPI0018FE1A08|nr:IclR family transcriptional regulator [Nocardia suismassiliense]